MPMLMLQLVLELKMELVLKLVPMVQLVSMQMLQLMTPPTCHPRAMEGEGVTVHFTCIL